MFNRRSFIQKLSILCAPAALVGEQKYRNKRPNKPYIVAMKCRSHDRDTKYESVQSFWLKNVDSSTSYIRSFPRLRAWMENLVEIDSFLMDDQKTIQMYLKFSNKSSQVLYTAIYRIGLKNKNLPSSVYYFDQNFDFKA